jgi:AcrR family transcriptional regulator
LLTAGSRAGLSKAAIIAAATKLLVSAGPDNFSIRLLATKLKVGPTTIHHHFKGDNLAWGMDLVIGRFGSLIFSETSEAAQAKPDAAKAGILKKISVLPAAEFPTLVQTAEALAADPLKRADPEYFGTLVDGVVDAIVHDLAKGKPRPGVTDLKLHRPARYSRNSPTVYLTDVFPSADPRIKVRLGAIGPVHVGELAKWPDNPSLDRQSQLRDIRLLLYSMFGQLGFRSIEQ